MAACHKIMKHANQATGNPHYPNSGHLDLRNQTDLEMFEKQLELTVATFYLKLRNQIPTISLSLAFRLTI
jgi:hypothetical protein